MEEGVVIKPAEAGNKSKQWVLIIIVILFLITAVGLVVWLALSRVNDSEQKEITCEEMTSEHDMMTCLSHEEPNEALNDRYDTALQKAFDEENYELFNELISDRTTNLALEGDCETPLNWLVSIENEYVQSLPILKQYGFYVAGEEIALECGDTEKEAYYQEKMRAIMTSKEYADAVAGDDYRIIGEDAEDEYIEDDGGEYEE